MLLCSCNIRTCIQLGLDVWGSFLTANCQTFYSMNNRTAKHDKHVKVGEGLWFSVNILVLQITMGQLKLCQHFHCNLLFSGITIVLSGIKVFQCWNLQYKGFVYIAIRCCDCYISRHIQTSFDRTSSLKIAVKPKQHRGGNGLAIKVQPPRPPISWIHSQVASLCHCSFTAIFSEISWSKLAWMCLHSQIQLLCGHNLNQTSKLLHVQCLGWKCSFEFSHALKHTNSHM